VTSPAKEGRRSCFFITPGRFSLYIQPRITVASQPPGKGSLSGLEKLLADLAVRKGHITRSQLNVALSARASSDPGAPLDVFLVSLGFIDQEKADELLQVVRGLVDPEESPAPVKSPPPPLRKAAPPPPRKAAAPAPARPAAPPPPKDSAAEDEEALTIVGSSTILEPIGRGPSGTVYRAFHGDLRRDVALKMIPANALNKPFLDQFGGRARRLCGLVHPNIARVIEVVDRPDGLFIASELVSGITLLDHVRRNRTLEVGQAVHVLKQIGLALHAVHKTKAIHGNLKAENVFLVGGLDVKLTDFGLARDDPEFLKTHADLAGSILHIMPPEQWRREAIPQSDLYACGVLWHFMLTGTFPFTGKGYLVTRQNHEEGIAPLPTECRKNLPPGADVLFKSLSHKDVSRRYPNVRVFLADLRYMEIGLSPRGARPAPPTPQRPPRPVPRPAAGQDSPLRRKVPPTGKGKATSR